MESDARIHRLVARWQELRDRGLLLAVDELCGDCPELIDELRRRVAALQSAVPVPEPDVTADMRSLEGHSPSPPAALDLPATIGRYRVVRRLGDGGFGRVFLAHDDDLGRPVAIKVPGPQRVAGPDGVQSFLHEARVVAELDHPHIVPVYDVGRTHDGLCFVVTKYIEGSNLAEWASQARPSFRASAELVAQVALALHHAHKHGLVHRDIKPTNILIDAEGKPFVADFGLALRDEDFDRGEGFTGTPLYTSPEQARGEGHRVDGRSDIFSLGVVLYELLAGRRPFRAGSLAQLLDQIATLDPRPLRQIDDAIPKELERICLKALCKRVAERYSTARDMAEDLIHFVQTDAGGQRFVGSRPEWNAVIAASPAVITAQETESKKSALNVVPKGLRSFDQHDAHFFLELLPGPRDRDGLPESLRFWKSRIESADPDLAFHVGLIHGPSGCGKSSLVKAGLLPRLAASVLPVYVDSTAEETETRLARRLRIVCQGLAQDRDLVETIAALRRERILGPGRKVLIVLDQFEQWLFAKRSEQNPELVAALRQCDGQHAQTIVMVRDDFWTAVTRFMRDVEVHLVEGENSAAVDFFDVVHARKVLAAFGCAYGSLPGHSSQLTSQQEAFLDQSVAELAQDGKVIPVRLALFADIVKGKPWTPTTLREVGGTEGVGVAFLEETFSASTASPEHRLHYKAAESVLKALLPESGTDIKGRMRSEPELQQASGYESRPLDFENLIHILDSELRLITPTEDDRERIHEGRAAPTQDSAIESDKSDSPHRVSPSVLGLRPSSPRYYQLTHDFLVQSLRDWLTRKQRETRRGRAEIRLAEQAALWNERSVDRHLPSLLEWTAIRAFTKKGEWTDHQRRMMRRAAWVYGLRASVAAAVLAAVVLTGLDIDRRVIDAHAQTVAQGLVEQVVRAKITEVPEIVALMAKHRHWVDPALHRVVAQSPDRSSRRLHASLALLPADDRQVEYVYNHLLEAKADEISVLREFLKPYQHGLTPKLWAVLESSPADDARLLPAASALALYCPEDARWGKTAGKVAEAMVQVDASSLRLWLDALRPVHASFTSSLTAILRDRQRPDLEHTMATSILADYAGDDAVLIANLLMDADPKTYRALFPTAQRQAESTLPLFHQEIAKRLTFSWDDPALDPSWSEPDSAFAAKIEAAAGILKERFAFCQTMSLGDFFATADGLRKSGYRPTRFRPYADGKSFRVAAVWARDGRDWRIAHDQSVAKILGTADQYRKLGFVPVDAAAYEATGRDGKSIERLAALWVAKRGLEDDAQLVVEAVGDEPQSAKKDVILGEAFPVASQPILLKGQQVGTISVWRRATKATPAASDVAYRSFSEWQLAPCVDGQAALLVDLGLSVQPRPTITELAASCLRFYDATISKAETAASARRAIRDYCYLPLGDYDKAIRDLSALIKDAPRLGHAFLVRAIAHARLGHQNEARADLAQFETSDFPQRLKLYLAVVVAAERGEVAGPAFDKLEAAFKRQPDDADLAYWAARAYAVASHAAARKGQSKSRPLADRAIELLGKAIENGWAYAEPIYLPDFDCELILDMPGFSEVMRLSRLDSLYSTAWSGDCRFEARVAYRLAPAAQLQRCRELISQGYRVVSFAAAQILPDTPPVAASVWHRPVISEQAKDQLAERQARAAIALLRMGRASEVWPLLRHSPDPRLRSFIINWLEPLGADAGAVAAELHRIESTHRAVVTPASPRSAEWEKRDGKPGDRPSSAAMTSILFHPETSIRRALILALGTYARDALVSTERDRLVCNLLDLFKNDPDPGIHGAAEWTLRRWNEQPRLNEATTESPRLNDRGDRRWFVNSQGQTFALIDGPIDFKMGSPPTEEGRNASFGRELRHRRIIPRRFAIATKEVTLEEYQQFVKECPLVEHTTSDRSNPDPRAPVNSASWYAAAAYCDWLSRKENLPECYERNDQGQYSVGMKSREDALSRTGYRLPTEAEWEYACRSGAITSRYYGESTKLLGEYAWYVHTSQEHARPCGNLLPNDLGLFDMLGNIYEYCGDCPVNYQPNRLGRINDHPTAKEYGETERVLRGGAFYSLPSGARSANRLWITSALHLSSFGFRVARTCD